MTDFNTPKGQEVGEALFDGGLTDRVPGRDSVEVAVGNPEFEVAAIRLPNPNLLPLAELPVVVVLPDEIFERLLVGDRVGLLALPPPRGPDLLRKAICDGSEADNFRITKNWMLSLSHSAHFYHFEVGELPGSRRMHSKVSTRRLHHQA